MEGRSAQYAGNSTVDCVASTKGGAVIFERSPLIVAIDYTTALVNALKMEQHVIYCEELFKCRSVIRHGRHVDFPILAMPIEEQIEFVQLQRAPVKATISHDDIEATMHRSQNRGAC